MSFESRDEDETEPTRFEMTFVEEGIADLVIKDSPMKPIQFVGISSANSAPLFDSRGDHRHEPK